MKKKQDDFESDDDLYASYDAYKALIEAGLSEKEALKRSGLTPQILKDLKAEEEEEAEDDDYRSEFKDAWEDDSDDFKDDFNEDDAWKEDDADFDDNAWDDTEDFADGGWDD